MKALLAGTAVLVLAVLCLYYSALKGAFVYYDGLEIQGNPAVTTPALWTKNFTYAAGNSMAGRGFYYRPLAFFSYALVYRFAGPEPLAFHLLQLLFYAASVWMLFLLGRELFHHDGIAFAGALLWAVHPLHVEAVAWISSFCDVGCALFYFWAFRLFLKAEKTEPPGLKQHLPAALLFLVALFFKEMAFSFPLLILAYWFIVAPRESWARRASRAVPYALALCFYLAVRVDVLGRVTAGRAPWNIPIAVLLRSVTLLGEHTKLFLWPRHLTLSRTEGMLGDSYGVWLLVALLGLAVVMAWRNREPMLAFLLLWWPATLAPCLDMRQVPLPYVADRYSFPSTAGLCLALAYVLLYWLPRKFPTLGPLRVGLPVIAVVALGWAFQTTRTIPHWRNEDVLGAYSIQEAPSVPVFHTVRGRYLATERGDLAGATLEYQTALRLCANFDASPAPAGRRIAWPSVAHDAHMGLANIAKERGQFAEAAREFELAAAEMPANGFAYKELGYLYLQNGDFQKAADYLEQAASRDPRDAEARFNLGVCLLKAGNYRAATAKFDEVAAINPDFPELWDVKAKALLHGGR
jgi:protein O-mannosyl-transferase